MMRFLGLVLIATIACTGCKPPTGDGGTSGTPSTNETTAPAITNETVPAPAVTKDPVTEAPVTEKPVEEVTPTPEEKPEMKKEEPAPPKETPQEEPAPAPEAAKEEMKAEEVNPEAAAQPTPAEEVEGLTDKATEETAPKEKAPEEKPAEKPAPEEGAQMKKPAEETTTVAAEASGPVEVKLTPENTLIQFVGIHKGDKPDPRTGKFGKFNGLAKAADGKLTEVTIVIDTPSLETEIEKLTNHLKSPDFFDVRQNPEAKFVSKSIETADDGTVKITGDLTLLKETKSISFPAKVKVGKEIALDAEFVINRVDFGMDYGTDNVHEDVTMTIKVGK